jgi:hypothetical protein
MTRHLAVAAGFLAIAMAWSLPLSLHLATDLPGGAFGDNAVFLWDFWWMRTALTSTTGFFHTPYLFAPAGVDLTLHTHMALPALVGATVLGGLPLIAALNITTLAALALNGFAAYLLAWRLTRERFASIVAGIIFGCSPYIAAHLNGHFNLTTAWTVPLFALAIAEALQRRPMLYGACAGLILAATAYIDYYYVTFELVFAVCALLLRAFTWSMRRGPGVPSRRLLRARTATHVLLALDLGLIVAILVSGGFAGRIGPIRFSAFEIFNPLQALWVLVAVAAWLHVNPRVVVAPRDGWSRERAIYACAAMSIAFALAAGPILFGGIRLWLNGDYVSQRYFWRSAPRGVDAASLVLGSPFEGLWRGVAQRLYSSVDIDPVESVAWLGVVPLVLAMYAIRRTSIDRDVRFWTAIAAVFFVWSFGTHVFALGRNTGVIGPAALLRFVPIVSNARIPGRAMVMVYLAVAMLAAKGLAAFRAAGPWRGAAPILVAALLMDFLAAPVRVAPAMCPPIYEMLRDRPERGAVAELPVGFGDGLGAVTPVENRMMLACQTIHERPLVGGFVARLPPRILESYRSDPLLAGWLRLSGASGAFELAAPPDARIAAERLKADGIALILLNRSTASPALSDYVDHMMPLTLVGADETRSLYVVAAATP